MMWKKADQSISSGDYSINLLAGRDINLAISKNFPTALVDQRIDEELSVLRKSRFFGEFDRGNATLTLGRRLVEGELSGGTASVRGPALAWCARFLSYTAELVKAEEYLNLAKSLWTCPEVEIAEAFVFSQKGDKTAALNTLAGINSPASRSAAFFIVAHHEGGESALDWLDKAGTRATDLDAEGKYFLLAKQLELGRWDAARESLNSLDDQDLDVAPVLHHMSAITHLLSTVPTEFRAIVLNQLPFDAANFPLASDATAMDARRKAQRQFCEAAKVARQLNCPGVASLDDEYALWLELRDPQTSSSARQQLVERFRDPKSALRLVPLGLQFGIKLDLAAVEQEIERQIALHGGITQEAAVARFALAFIQKSPKDVASYIALHYDELSKYLDKKSMESLQIEMLSRAGLPERATECLDFLLEQGLSEAEEARLRRIIEETEGADPVELRKAQFRQTDSLRDLVALVDELEAKRNWEDLCEFGEVLFERTHSVRDSVRLAKALDKTQQAERLVTFLKGLTDLREQSRNLQMVYCWSLYHEGALLESRTELAKLSDQPDDPNYRALKVNLGIALGDWASLSAFVAAEYQARDKRNAQDLIGAAQLAHHIGSPHAKELTFAAAANSNNDASILAAAYFLSSKAGWEDDEEVVQWLHKAAELSGDEGPLQKMTLKELVAQKPEWDRRQSEIWQMLRHGDIPMFLAGQALNRSLIDLMLFPGLTNLSQRDPRRRSAISSYSGKRQPTPVDTNWKTVGIDATALVTLSFLNLLDKALDDFEIVYVPHSILTWLFQEKQKATFHQPSRIRDARQIRHLLATDIVERFVTSTVADSDLSSQIGDELAVLIAEAEKARDDDDRQRIVVRPSPVHRLGSLMEEEADLTEHAGVISSCLAIVEKLRQKGQITAEEEKRACAYLQLYEKPWPHQPDITDGAVLYLDDLATTYLLHLGILEKLQSAGFTAVLSQSKLSESNALISYESISDKVNEAIESIRNAVGSRIESGKIRVGRRHKVNKPEEESIFEHPSVGALSLAGYCDAVISDDRFINQHESINEGGGRAIIFSTLDLLDALVSNGSISLDDYLEYRTMLRRAGYFFIPIREDELDRHLNACSVFDAKVVETAELKAIRENLLHVRMCSWLQLPKEAPWLIQTLRVFVMVLKTLWRDGADLSAVRAMSDWIFDMVDVRGWAHCLGAEAGDNMVKIGRGAHILMLLMPPPDAQQNAKEAYWEWIEDRILAPTKEQFPDLYGGIIEWEKRQISKIADADVIEGETK